jgi:hypothetical protein
MKYLFSQVRGLKINCKIPAFVADLEEIYVNKSNGNIVFVRTKEKNGERHNISLLDVMIWDKKKIIVREISTLVSVENTINLNGLEVINQNNKSLGWVNDFLFDPDLMYIDRFYVRGGWKNLWKKRIFVRLDVLEITDKYIKVNDINLSRNVMMEACTVE